MFGGVLCADYDRELSQDVVVFVSCLKQRRQQQARLRSTEVHFARMMAFLMAAVSHCYGACVCGCSVSHTHQR